MQVSSLLLTAASTVILGIQAIPARAAWALPLVALVTVVGGCEAFFNWRSRWILMEETQYRLNRLRDEIDYYLVMTAEPNISRTQLDTFFQDQQSIWSEVSRRWVGFRRCSLMRLDGRILRKRSSVTGVAYSQLGGTCEHLPPINDACRRACRYQTPNRARRRQIGQQSPVCAQSKQPQLVSERREYYADSATRDPPPWHRFGPTSPTPIAQTGATDPRLPPCPPPQPRSHV